MMRLSSWSEAESGVTMEIGDGGAGDGGEVYAFGSPRRCVLPKVEVEFNRSDQQVPVYQDQKVPVWPSCVQPGGVSLKRKVAHGSSGIGHGERFPSVYLRCAPGSDASRGGGEKDCNGGRGNSLAVDEVSNSEVSFDDITSMYQSAVMEKMSHKWSRALRAILKHRSKKRSLYRPRLRRNVAGSLNSSATIEGISAQLLRFSQRHVTGDVDESLLRSLQEAIERTSICDCSSDIPHNSDTSLLPRDLTILQVQRCNQRCRDPLTVTSPTLSTSSS